MSKCKRVRSLDFGVATLMYVLLSGCGDNGIGTLYPVNGRVLQNAEPLKVDTGYVLFKPDLEKGNSTEFEPAGTIDVDGNYAVYTQHNSGAPPGWYKVIITASGEAEVPSSNQSSTRPLSKSLVSPEYGQEKTAPLSIEVIASPPAGAYDLNVTE